MLDVRQYFVLGHSVALQLVRDEDAWGILQACQEALEEALRRGAITAALHQDVQHDAGLIHRPPEIAQFPLNADEHLIEVPFVTGPRSPPTQIVGEGRAELQAPSADALVRDDDAELGQQQLNISEAQAEHVLGPYCVADEVCRKTVAMVRVWRLLHATILAQAVADRQLT